MTTLTDTQVITASGGLVELGYKESSSTTNITVSGTAGSGTEIVAPLTVVCDGGPVLVEFEAVNAAPNPTAGHYISFSLYVDGSEYSRFWTYSQTPSSGFFATPVHATLRISPSAGSHTFSVRAFISNSGSNGTVGSGDKSTTGGFPPRLRVSKIVQATQWPAVTTGTIICTSSTRPASPFEGQKIYETDTDRELRWSGTAWISPTVGFNTPAVRVERTSNYAWPGGGSYITWQTDSAGSGSCMDTDNMWSAGDPTKITINTSGIYVISGGLSVFSSPSTSGSVSALEAFIEKNGSITIGNSDGNAMNGDVQAQADVGAIAKLSAGDTLRMGAYISGSGSNLQVRATGATHFSAALIGSA